MKTNEFTKKRIYMINCYMKDFIHNFKGGEGDEEDRAHLQDVVEKELFALPEGLAEKIRDFIKSEIDPLVDAPDISFPIAAAMNRTANTDEEISRIFAEFFRVLFETEQSWDEFAARELKPLLVD